MDKSTLRENVSAGSDSHFFDRSSMRFFGDTMSNYGVRAKPVNVETWSGETVLCWVLYRKRPVKNGMQSDAFFACEDFRRVLPKR